MLTKNSRVEKAAQGTTIVNLRADAHIQTHLLTGTKKACAGRCARAWDRHSCATSARLPKVAASSGGSAPLQLPLRPPSGADRTGATRSRKALAALICASAHSGRHVRVKGFGIRPASSEGGHRPLLTEWNWV